VTSAYRTLSADVIEVLTYWPGIVHAVRPLPVDLTVLPPFLNEMLGELPWWNPAWQVTQVEPAYPREIAGNEPRRVTRYTEVSVPGTVSRDPAHALPFSARIRFEVDLLIRFQAKIGDVVLSPAVTAAGQPEPHPFGAVFSQLMDQRGISIREMAMQCGRAMSTIKGLRGGWLNPHRVLVQEVARVMKMSEQDMAVIAGLDDRPDEEPASN
jgi:hypothetical protein